MTWLAAAGFMTASCLWLGEAAEASTVVRWVSVRRKSGV